MTISDSNLGTSQLYGKFFSLVGGQIRDNSYSQPIATPCLVPHWHQLATHWQRSCQLVAKRETIVLPWNKYTVWIDYWSRRRTISKATAKTQCHSHPTPTSIKMSILCQSDRMLVSTQYHFIAIAMSILLSIGRSNANLNLIPHLVKGTTSTIWIIDTGRSLIGKASARIGTGHFNPATKTGDQLVTNLGTRLLWGPTEVS